jgi:hypothetical protein
VTRSYSGALATSASGTLRAFEAGEDGLELIAVGPDRPEGRDGVSTPSAWIEEG